MEVSIAIPLLVCSSPEAGIPIFVPNAAGVVLGSSDKTLACKSGLCRRVQYGTPGFHRPLISLPKVAEVERCLQRNKS
jgi:hypothetical protein